MCGSTKAPPVVKQDPVADEAAAKAKATQASNSAIALRRQQRLQNSLLTMGPSGTTERVDTPGTLLAQVSRTPSGGGSGGLGSGSLLGGVGGGRLGGGYTPRRLAP